MAERVEICQSCNREVPRGTSCSSMQAEECPNMSGGRSEDEFLGSIDAGPSDDGY